MGKVPLHRYTVSGRGLDASRNDWQLRIVFDRLQEERHLYYDRWTAPKRLYRYRGTSPIRKH